MLDERQRRLARNVAIAVVLAGCSAAQYAAVSKAATFRVLLAGDSIVEGCEQRTPGHAGGSRTLCGGALHYAGAWNFEGTSWRSGDDRIGRGLTADGSHPTAAGYELMGRQVAA